MKTLAMRLALRKAMRKHPDRRSDIRAILRDSDLLEAVTEEMVFVCNTELGGVGDGSFLEFFQMLLDNLPRILEIITSILILFADEE